MSAIDFAHLTTYAKSFSGLTPEKEAILILIGPDIIPHLKSVTDGFYNTLANIPQTAPYLEGRLDLLKSTHLKWLTTLFNGQYNIEYTQAMYRVGHVHVKVNLPVEFMAGGMSLIGEKLFMEIENLYPDDSDKRQKAHGAINSIIGFSLIVMQQSFQNSSLHEELEKFLKITGMSRALFNNLAAAYSK